MEPKEFFWPVSAVYSSVTRWMQPGYADIAGQTEIKEEHKVLLDIGGGDGRLAMEFANQYPCFEKIVSGDFSRDMTRRAARNIKKKHLEDKIFAEVQDVHNLTYTDALFDVIVSFGALHHWRDPVKALNELCRVLKPKGLMTIYDGFDRPSFQMIHKAVSGFGGSFAAAVLYWIGSKDTLRKEEIVEIVEEANMSIDLDFEVPLATLKYVKP
jgi:ubiquinone/menaquinone biosynthesis C-methylase UbiE